MDQPRFSRGEEDSLLVSFSPSVEIFLAKSRSSSFVSFEHHLSLLFASLREEWEGGISSCVNSYFILWYYWSSFRAQMRGANWLILWLNTASLPAVPRKKFCSLLRPLSSTLWRCYPIELTEQTDGHRIRFNGEIFLPFREREWPRISSLSLFLWWDYRCPSPGSPPNVVGWIWTVNISTLCSAFGEGRLRAKPPTYAQIM